MNNVFIFETGKTVKIEDLTIDHFPIVQVAHQLGRLYRWGGQGMTVAQHSVLAWLRSPPILKKAALLHDVSEMFIGEIPNSVKAMSPEILRYEERIQKQIFRIFNIDWDHMAQIHQFDKLCGRMGGHRLYPADSRFPELGCPPFLGSDDASFLFTSTFYGEFSS